MMLTRLVIFLSVCGTFALAQDTPPEGSQQVTEKAAPSAKPFVRKLDETRYQIGKVIFDQKTREIRFPTKLNMTQGLLEYLIVHQNGKLHEALLSTEVSPTDLNLAFTLLRYPPSRELYPLPDEGGAASDIYPQVPADVKARSRVTIDVEWTTVDGKVRRVPVNEWIQHGVKSTSMPVGPWVYGGSEFFEGKFIPETSGDIVAIFLAMSALINYPGADNNNDDVWTPFPKRVPAEGTDVTVIIGPYQKEKPLPKP